MVTERLLQFLWQMQYFNRGSLVTSKGEPLEILSPGILNLNQGPDFYNARIKIGATTWAGSVELHLVTSGWDLHGHSNDRNFSNVILHVVWENDLDDHPLPLLELKERVPKFLMRRYEELMLAPSFIPCEKMISHTDPLLLDHWKDRLLAERIERKAEAIRRMLEQQRHPWHELYWWLLARNFGYAVNADAFEAVARTLSINLLSKQGGQIHQLESLLLGQAGLLTGSYSDAYPVMLQKEYYYLKNKYGLIPVVQPVHFLRMRPANFPTVRLAQLAMLVHSNGHMLEAVRDVAELPGLRKLFDISANDYWSSHYIFDKPSEFREKKIGNAMFSNILTNTIVPFLYAYGRYNGTEHYKQKAMDWLTETGPENNSVTSGFIRAGIQNGNAADSQSLIELKTQYCDHKRCLDCSIGNALLSAGS